MIVLLIVPTFHYHDHSYPTFLSFSDFPTGYGYIAAALKRAGHEVVGLNLNNDSSFHSAYEMIDTKIRKALEDKPDLIAMGGICIDYKFLKDAISICRQANPNIPIVLGGGIVTNDAEFIFKTLKPDYAITGEAENLMVHLADTLPEHAIYHSSIVHPDDLPFPDYEPFGIQDMLDNYSMATRVLYKYSRPYARPFGLVASRSCPFSCTFCTHGGDRPKYRVRSIADIMEEIRVNYELYKFNVLIIVDELFAVDKKRMREFCEAILEEKKTYGWDFDWMFQTHANAKLDKEVLTLAKQAGCYLFSYGLESASPKVLESMNKRTKIPQLIEAVKLAHECGIGFAGNLIFGDPVEDEKTIKETLQFYAHHCRDAFVFLGILMPYPGSQLFDYCVQKGLINNKQQYYESIDQHYYNMTSMPDRLFLDWMKFILMLESSWLWVETTTATEMRENGQVRGGTMYEIDAVCPHCGEKITYGQTMGQIAEFIGVGCTKCGKKIRINLEGVCPITNSTVRDAVLTLTR